MTVYANKPAFNVREKLKELDKPSSVAGEAVLRAETPQEQQALIGAGPNRNLIINGGFQIWQRGTSGTSGYVADRWRGQNCTAQSKQYDAEVGNYLQLTATNAAIMYYGIELDETGQVAPFEVGETYTISLKVKSTAVMYKPNCSFRDNLTYGTNTVFTSKEIKPHRGTGEWEDVVYQFTVTSAPHSTAPLFELTLVSFEYANTPINIAQVQMVKGKVATPFEHRSYGEELALCQRYFERYYPAGQMQIYNESSVSNHKWIRIFHTIKRSPPALAAHSGIVNKNTNGLGTISSLTRQGGSINEMSIRVGMSGSTGTANAIYHFDPVAGTAYFDLDCEL